MAKTTKRGAMEVGRGVKTAEGRSQPHNLEAERSVLGAILLHDDVLSLVSGTLRGEDFYRVAHRYIYEAMLALSERHSAIDPLTIREELGRRQRVDDCGGPAYVTALVDGIPRSTNIEYYAGIVKEKAVLRELIAVGTVLAEKAYDPQADATTVLGEAESQIYTIGERQTEGALVDARELAAQGLAMIHRLRETGQLVGVSTGLALLDRMVLGLHGSHLYVVAARPGRGKSAFALHLARWLAIQLGLGVAFFSLEMSREELLIRMMASEGRMDGQAIRAGGFGPKYYQQLEESLVRIEGSGLWVDDTPGRTILQIRSQCRRLKSRHNLSMIVIDYLQLMTPVRRRETTREQDVATMAWGCKLLAKELDVPVVMLAQLSRAVEQRAGQRPQLSDLRESGAIEQHADDIWFLNPPDVLDGTCSIIIGKQRQGPVGIDLTVGYNPAHYRFWNLSEREDERA